jgi:hypothetical protein
MPLSWNEIRSRALAFSKEWATEQREHAEAKTFWDDFFKVFEDKRDGTARNGSRHFWVALTGSLR